MRARRRANCAVMPAAGRKQLTKTRSAPVPRTAIATRGPLWPRPTGVVEALLAATGQPAQRCRGRVRSSCLIPADDRPAGQEGRYPSPMPRSPREPPRPRSESSLAAGPIPRAHALLFAQCSGAVTTEHHRRKHTRWRADPAPPRRAERCRKSPQRDGRMPVCVLPLASAKWCGCCTRWPRGSSSSDST